MSTPEYSSETKNERWWSYDTPYDIVNRSALVRQGQTQRVEDIDAYVAYINEDMEPGYRAVTYIDERSKEELLNAQGLGTRVYKRDDNGNYYPHAHITVNGKFYADQIIYSGDDVVLINNETGIGVSPFESVKIVPLNLEDENDIRYRNHRKNFGELVRKLLHLKKGEKSYRSFFDHEFYL